MKKMLAGLVFAGLMVLCACAPAWAQTIKDNNVNNHLTVFQQTVTASAVALPAYLFTNGLTCAAKAGNAASIEIGGSTVNTTVTGAGNGIILAAGTNTGVMPINNSGLLYIIGTAGDVISCWGN